MKVDRRTLARELAMQALYQLDVQGPDLLPRLPSQFFRDMEADEFVNQLAMEWTSGAWQNLVECDQLITASILHWDFSRIAPVDKSILRLAVYQLRFCQDIPPKVVINEAIEMAKKYSSDKAPKFVNGVLDAVLKKT